MNDEVQRFAIEEEKGRERNHIILKKDPVEEDEVGRRN